jgi:hypothetical protein
MGANRERWPLSDWRASDVSSGIATICVAHALTATADRAAVRGLKCTPQNLTYVQISFLRLKRGTETFLSIMPMPPGRPVP